MQAAQAASSCSPDTGTCASYTCMYARGVGAAVMRVWYPGGDVGRSAQRQRAAPAPCTEGMHAERPLSMMSARPRLRLQCVRLCAAAAGRCPQPGLSPVLKRRAGSSVCAPLRHPHCGAEVHLRRRGCLTCPMCPRRPCKQPRCAPGPARATPGTRRRQGAAAMSGRHSRAHHGHPTTNEAGLPSNKAASPHHSTHRATVAALCTQQPP